MVAAALACALIAVLLTAKFSLLFRVEQFVQDWETASVFAPREAQDPDILIVALDEPTLEQFHYRSPIDRQFVSDLLQRIDSHGPAAIGLDLLFDQPTEPAKDKTLYQALRSVRSPLVVSYVADIAVSTDQKAYEDQMVPAGLRGLADLRLDDFDTARFAYPGSRIGKNYILGFGRALAQKTGVATPAEQVPIVWRGRPSATDTDPSPRPFRQISAQVAGLMPADWFHGKIVLIGSDVTLVDRHRTPFSVIYSGDDGQLPGVVIQAHILSQFLHHKPSPLPPLWLDIATAMSMALLAGSFAALTAPLWLRLSAGFVALLLFWAGGVALFHATGLMLGLVAPPLAAAASFAAVDSLTGLEARRQRAFIQGAFGRYVSPRLVEMMVEDPTLLQLGGKRREMTYLFTDIQNFTTMTEGLESDRLTELINAYLDGMTRIVKKHDGMVDKFIGDAVMAVFNAPVDIPNHAAKAVHCMLEMDRFTESFRKEQNAAGVPLGLTRIGVHTGAAVGGNFGSHEAQSYTVQGDAVNTAARLEGINKYLGTRLCVSGATRALCPDVNFRPVASVVLKGKTVALELWEPLHPGEYAPDFLIAYGRAYEALREGRPEAADLFATLLQDWPDDPCVRLHVSRLKDGESGVEMVMSEK